MTTSRRRFLGLGGLILLGGLPGMRAARAAPAAVRLSEADIADIRRVEALLDDMRTVDARFLQVASDGSYAEGRVRIRRPGDLRIDYDPPSKVRVMTNGLFLAYLDYAVQQATYIPIDSTPAGILVAERIAILSKDLMVTRFAKAGGLLELGLARAADPAEGTLTLVFNENPLMLRQWVVTDAQGVTTTVTLVDTRFGIPLPADTFRFRDPNTHGWVME